MTIKNKRRTTKKIRHMPTTYECYTGGLPSHPPSYHRRVAFVTFRFPITEWLRIGLMGLGVFACPTPVPHGSVRVATVARSSDPLTETPQPSDRTPALFFFRLCSGLRIRIKCSASACTNMHTTHAPLCMRRLRWDEVLHPSLQRAVARTIVRGAAAIKGRRAGQQSACWTKHTPYTTGQISEVPIYVRVVGKERASTKPTPGREQAQRCHPTPLREQFGTDDIARPALSPDAALATKACPNLHRGKTRPNDTIRPRSESSLVRMTSPDLVFPRIRRHSAEENRRESVQRTQAH